jgi:hypothetical protein
MQISYGIEYSGGTGCAKVLWALSSRKTTNAHAGQCISIQRSNASIRLDEHAQTSMSEHGPRPARAQTAQKQHAGLLELHAQPSAASIRLPGRGMEGLCSVRRTTFRTSADVFSRNGPRNEQENANCGFILAMVRLHSVTCEVVESQRLESRCFVDCLHEVEPQSRCRRGAERAALPLDPKQWRSGGAAAEVKSPVQPQPESRDDVRKNGMRRI